MIENPYHPPRLSHESIEAEPSLPKQARVSFRLAASVLLIPALYNYWALDTYAIHSGSLPNDLANFYRSVNLLAFIIGSALILILGLPILEAIARLLRFVFASGTDSSAWLAVLYRSLSGIVIFAIPGAVLWAIWVFGFYQMGFNFYAISWAIGVPGHLLAACWYGPLVHRWYCLAKSQPTHSTS